MGQAREQVLVQALVAEAPVERFDGRVLRGLARFDLPQRDPAAVRPRQHGAPAELQAVVPSEQEVTARQVLL